MRQKRAYLYRCYPTPDQAHTLARTFGCTRFVYNWALRLRSDAYAERHVRVSYAGISAAFTKLRRQPETAWLSEVAYVPCQQALWHLDTGFRNFFEGRANYPTFKKKRGRQSAEYTTSAFKWDSKELVLAKMREPLAIHWSRPLPKEARPTTITLSRDPAGRYFVSFLIEEDITPLPVSPKSVGIDLGLHDLVTLSTGEKVGNERFFAKEARRLATLQRRHAKKQKGSKNREKARRKVARIHARIADRRRDFQHKLTTRIIRENQTVCVESLCVKNLMQNHHLAQAIIDVGWGEIVRQLEYKAAWYGRTLVAIGTFYPSSKQCSGCGHVLGSLSLDIRQWICSDCGACHDRDVNAALNIEAAGLAVLACGEAVRPGRATARQGASQ